MSKPSQQTEIARATHIIKTLIQAQPEATCTLRYEADWQLLIAAILASQCTDERVNQVTRRLFARCPSPQALAELPRAELEEIVKPCGLYRNKAKHIIASCRLLVEEYGGAVPRDVTGLQQFPGVGQKIAYLLMGELFQEPYLVVDTHCGRLARLLGFSQAKNPVQVEKDLREVVPPRYRVAWGHHMVELGRHICQARCRRCAICPIREDCLYAGQHEAAITAAMQEGALHACL